MRLWVVFAALCLATAAPAETLVAARTVRAQAILGAADLAVVPGRVAGTYAAIDEALGMEARVVLYAGRPVRFEDIGPPAIIERNSIVRLIFRRGRLTITAEARALGRAGVGDRVRVMNLASRTTVTGFVRADGAVIVGGRDPGAVTSEVLQ